MKIGGIDVIRDSREAIYALENDPDIALDLETSGLRPHKDKIAVFSMYGKNTKKAALIHVRGHIPEDLKNFLATPGKNFTLHNGVGFDIPFLLAHGIDITNSKIYDTLPGAGVVITTNRAGQRKTLQAEIDRRLGEHITKNTDHSSWMNSELDTMQLVYCLEDVAYLHELRKSQEDKADERNIRNVLEEEMELVPLIARMTTNGLPISTARMQASHDATRETLKELEEKFYARHGKINVNSAEQVKKVLKELGFKFPTSFNTKGELTESTAEKALGSVGLRGAEGILENAQLEILPGMPIEYQKVVAGIIAQTITDIFEIRRLRKRLDTYDTDWINEYVHEGLLHPTFNQAATNTFRFSSSNPNFQQWPRKFRSVIGGKPGHKMVFRDYSQIECVVAAWLAEDTKMIQMIESGEDIHKLVASQIYGVSPDEIVKGDWRRQVAKSANFELIFGGGAVAFRDYVLRNKAVITLAESRDIVRKYFQLFRGLNRARSRAYDLAQAGHSIVQIRLANGAIRDLIGNDLKPTTILNTSVQGNAAIGMKNAMREANRRGLGMYLSATVHDELIACVPEAWAKEYDHELEECMQFGMKQIVGCKFGTEGFIDDYWVKD